MISIIIPTLNEATTIERILVHLAGLPLPHETIVVDNGSTDATLALAAPWARTATSAPGRGPAMNAGAALAAGETLLFLHADAGLPSDGLEALTAALADPALVGGSFSIRFDGGDWRSAVVEALYGMFARLGFNYGDSGIFVRRSVFKAIGGFKPLPLMEDIDLCLRLRRAGRTVRLRQTIVSSDRRWRKQGFLKMAVVYLLIQGLYLAGWRHPSLFRLYRPVR